MIEVLVTVVITLTGLLGMAGLVVRTHIAEFESYQRAQALILLSDMVDKLNANRKAAGCYAFSGLSTGSPFLGTSANVTPACTAYGTTEGQTRAVADLNDWNGKLLGTAETKDGNAVGAMRAARGCVSFNSATATYQVSVAWQGSTGTVDPTTVDPTLVCASGQYGPENQRRIVSVTLSIATLR